MTGRARSAVCAAALVVISACSALADDLLVTHSDSLTSYKPSAASAVQDVRPLAMQRGVGIDGAGRASGSFPWSFEANPFEGTIAGETLGSVRLATGAHAPFEIDLAFPAEAQWIIGRTFNARQETSGASHRDSDGYQGKNWFQTSQPELVFFDNDSTPGTRETEDLIYLVYGADRYIEFNRTADDVDTFRGVNGAGGIIEYESGSPDLYIYYDLGGNRTYFFGDNTSDDDADWQLWKFVDPAGNTAYVGDAATASTAVTNGYNDDATISKAYDSAGRRYCYTYSTIDSVSRLMKVYVETDAGGGWGDCESEEFVGEVVYEYYETGDNDDGDNGNLQLVTVTTPLSDTAQELAKRKYYRYYTGTYHATNNPGHPDTMKMALGFEGVRRADWDPDSGLDHGSVTAEFLTAEDADLKPYADVYFKYDTSYRIISLFFNGECGCGGGTNGEHKLTYAANPSYSDGSGYDTAWSHRVVVEPPTGGAWVTQFFDEVGQPLSRVLTDIDPASTGTTPQKWVTQMVRNSSGQVTETHTPANLTAYTHDTSGSPDGAITTSSSDGLVWYHERVSSGATTGFLQGMRQKAGSASLSTSSEYVSWIQYTTRDLNLATGVNVSKPVVEKTRAFHTATTNSGSTTSYDETTRAFTWWETSTNTEVLYIAAKKITTTAPAVSTGNNGSGSATSTAQYLRKDGSVAFNETARGIVGYTGYTNGQVTTQVEDADTDTGTTYPSGEHPYTDFGIASSTAGLHRITTYTYDAQGRLSTTELRDTWSNERKSMKWYATLGDDRLVTFRIPRVTQIPGPGGGTNYFGPGTGTVTNQGGQTEDCSIFSVDDTTIAPSDYLVEVLTGQYYPELIDGFNSNVGDVSRLTSSNYNKTGTRLESRWVFFDIPATMASASEGTHYDEWRFGYDAVGRQVKTESPTGTISTNTFDELGRVTERSIGTDDSGGGSDDMVTTESIVYDSGNDGGNSLLTTQTAYVEDGTTGKRDTAVLHDYRGRGIVTLSPQAPYRLAKYDNLSRLVATASYSSSSGLDAADDPTSLATNRVALSQVFYDERGQLWKSQLHKIDQSDGSDDDTLQSLTWFDPDGRVIKSDSEQLTKTRYDRLGRAFQAFALATDDDAAYSDVYDSTNKYASLSGDKVLEETQVGYNNADQLVVEGAISREHGDTTTTGPLDVTYESGGDADPLKFTVADVKGRIQITAHWYDYLERPTTTAYYGTNDATDNVGLFTYSTTAPTASSASQIVTRVTHAPDGSVSDTTDPSGAVTQYHYDDAGRLVVTINNYRSSTTLTEEMRDESIYTRYAYEDGLQRYIWTDMQGDDSSGAAPVGANKQSPADDNDQVTEYIYGTPKGTVGDDNSGTGPVESAIGTGHLLHEVVYPEQSSGQSAAYRTVTFAYNAQGQEVWTKDQEGNITETDFDTSGRETHRRVTTLASGFDGTVRRISTTYLGRGPIDKVTQYDNATAGSGSVVDDLRYTYDDWGNIAAFKQDVDSDLDGTASGRAAFEVGYTYAKATTGRNTIRRTKTDLPGSVSASNTFSAVGGSLDSAASRVTYVLYQPGGALLDVAEYEYLGVAQLVGTDLLQPDARWDLFEGATGTNPYPDLDRFNRVTSSRWTGYKNGGTRDFYDVDIAYDYASMITGVTDSVHKDSSGNRNFDVLYSMDELYRLTRAEEGTLSGTISNRTRDEQWLDSSSGLGLSQTGNWINRRLDLDGNGTFSGTGELDETNTFSLANELKARNTDSSGGDEFTLAYDKVGNQTDDGEDYTYVYDAFGRLMEVKNSTPAIVAEYEYNGLGFRTGWHYDTDSDANVDSADPWFWFCYDDQWRIVATFRDTDSNPKEVFIHHNAGLGGYGGSSYIDSVILRDRDANTAWNAQADSTREERTYYCQNWRADVSALLSSSGKMIEWAKYSAYGVPYALPAGDTDSDGDWDATDAAAIITSGSYDVREDAELDGDVDSSDAVHAQSITGGYQTLGRGVLSSAAVNNRRGYAGYEYDPTFEGADRHLYHVRHRVYDADIGRQLRRDPYGYLDGMSMYAYVQGMAIIAADPWGLFTCVGGCGISPVNAPPPGGGGGPPSCAGGTCGTPQAPGPSSSPGSGPPVCAGGTCGIPIDTSMPAGGGSPLYCAGSTCSVPAICPSSGGGGGGGGSDGGGGGGGGSGGGGSGGGGGGCGSGGSGGGGSGAGGGGRRGKRRVPWHLNPDWTNLDDLPLDDARVGSGPLNDPGRDIRYGIPGAVEIVEDFTSMAACMAACMTSDMALDTVNQFSNMASPSWSPYGFQIQSDGSLKGQFSGYGTAGGAILTCKWIGDQLDDNIRDNQEHLGKRLGDMKGRLAARNVFSGAARRGGQGLIMFWLIDQSYKNLGPRRERCEEQCNGGKKVV